MRIMADLEKRDTKYGLSCDGHLRVIWSSAERCYILHMERGE